MGHDPTHTKRRHWPLSLLVAVPLMATSMMVAFGCTVPTLDPPSFDAGPGGDDVDELDCDALPVFGETVNCGAVDDWCNDGTELKAAACCACDDQYCGLRDACPLADGRPRAVDDEFSGTEDAVLTIQVADLLENDDGAGTLAVTAVSDAINGAVELVDTAVRFTPQAHFAGAASFRYELSSGTASDEGVVFVALAPVNDAPVATDDTAVTNVDAAAVVPAAVLLANDTDIDGDRLTVTTVSAANNGTVSLTGTVITFTPRAGFVGTGSFDYALSDGTVTDTGRVAVTVGALNCDALPVLGNTVSCGTIDWCGVDATPGNDGDLVKEAACCACDSDYCDRLESCGPPPAGPAESCMECHNGSEFADYAGPGILNPHPFGGVTIQCTTCHGGDGTRNNRLQAHIPPPPQIGDQNKLNTDPQAWFNRLTLAGIDSYPNYVVEGRTYTALEYLKFINPGDLRVVSRSEGCGECHQDHSTSMARSSPIGTEIGFFSSVTFNMGITNPVADNRVNPNNPNNRAALWGETAGDYAYRAIENPDFVRNTAEVGEVPKALAAPEHAERDGEMFNNRTAFRAGRLAQDVVADGPDIGKVIADSPLAKLYQTQISVTCGDCHAGSAGANNRYGDFRSSGCTACHMEYSPDGRSRSTDPNIDIAEPANPDAIAQGERPHTDTHQIRNVARVLPNGGGYVRGISDRACVGCHQGSNRTVLQYWGIRLDQNADLVNGTQYPANPASFETTALDERLYDPAVGNNTFNGRNANQYILTEDYDDDNRDDTPADVHYEAGLGCIDCHGSRDVHAGTDGDWNMKIMSAKEQVVKVRCESCHGTVDEYARTIPCENYDGESENCAVDAASNALRNTMKDSRDNYWLVSRVDGGIHYIPQTRDIVVNTDKSNPITGKLVYSPKASYAMGRADQSLDNGIGPLQATAGLVRNGFSHTDNVDCIACHASWQNQCLGCHLRSEYNENLQQNLFSNLNGERIVIKQANADFTYISPLMTYLAVNNRNRVTATGAGMKVFYGYTDDQGTESNVFTFTDRRGVGARQQTDGNPHPGLSQYQMAAHSVRGRVTGTNEGVRYCVACHNTTAGVAAFGATYQRFLQLYNARDYEAFAAPINDTATETMFDVLQEHIGQNPGNQLNSPFFVHMAAGLGSGLFLSDANGCPVNPLDDNTNRPICLDANGNRTSPRALWEANPAARVAQVRFDWDRLVEVNGITNASSSHPLTEFGANLRDGSQNDDLTGPLGRTLLNRLTNIDPDAAPIGYVPLVLDTWITADGEVQGTNQDVVR
jgi:hypothetical protein